MKNNRDAAAGWLRKAESDLINAELCLVARKALDTACFGGRSSVGTDNISHKN